MIDPVEKAVDQFDLVLPEAPRRGGYGDLSGSGTGSSLEYQDHREYTPGDDVRRIDWNAYARTESYIIKQYREEVFPVVEVILDGSRSMAVDPEKRTFAIQTAVMIARLGKKLHTGARIVFAGPRIKCFEQNWIDRLRDASFSARQNLTDQQSRVGSFLRTGSIRYLVTDGLFPSDPGSFLSFYTRDSSSLSLLQILSEQERQPDLQGGHRLVDVETNHQMDCYVTEREINRYKQALRDHCSRLQETAVSLQAKYAQMNTGHPFLEQVRDQLPPAKILTTAG